MNYLHHFYLFLPVWMQNLALSLFALLNDHRRYGGGYKNIEKEVISTFDFGEQKIKCVQAERLRAHLNNAVKSRYWSRVFKEYGVDVNGDPEQELRKLPIITKKDVRENAQDILISDISDKLYSVHTSGTTGAGLCLWETREAEAIRWATWWRYRIANGIEHSSWCGLFAGRDIIRQGCKKPPFYRINYKSKQVLFSCFNLSKESVVSYVDAINKFGFEWLHGYPSFLSELSSLAIQAGVELENRPRIITLSCENLTESRMRLIESFFGVKPIQHYGLAESVANFSQYPNDDFLTVDEDFSYVEFIGDGEAKKIVGTNFTNPAFPLFRYDTDDVAVNVNENVFPRTLACIDGRAAEEITLPSGRKIGQLDLLFKDVFFVNESQIYQPVIDKIIVRMVVNSSWNEGSETFLMEVFRKRMGDEVTITFEYVDKIKRTSTGKVRSVISKVG